MATCVAKYSMHVLCLQNLSSADASSSRKCQRNCLVRAPSNLPNHTNERLFCEDHLKRYRGPPLTLNRSTFSWSLKEPETAPYLRLSHQPMGIKPRENEHTHISSSSSAKNQGTKGISTRTKRIRMKISVLQPPKQKFKIRLLLYAVVQPAATNLRHADNK